MLACDAAVRHQSKNQSKDQVEGHLLPPQWEEGGSFTLLFPKDAQVLSGPLTHTNRNPMVHWAL